MKVTGNQFMQILRSQGVIAMGICEFVAQTFKLFSGFLNNRASEQVYDLRHSNVNVAYYHGVRLKTVTVLGLVLIAPLLHAESSATPMPTHDVHYQHILDDMTIMPSASNIAASELEGDALQVHVLQSGHDNVSVVTQQGSQLSASVKQVGDFNTSYAFQEGEQSALTVKQYHHDNTSHIIQSGEAQSIYLKQLGHSEMTIEQWGEDKRLYIVQPPYTDITIRQLP